MTTGKALLLGAAMAGLLSTTALARDGFEHYGSWSNVEVSESSEGHARGYLLDLWRHRGKLLGVLLHYVGPAEDPPIGEIEHLVLDAKTGEIIFKVRMSVGLVFDERKGEWVPSRDLYLFRGHLKNDSIEGTIEKRDPGRSKADPVRETVVLKRDVSKSDWTGSTYQRWKEVYAPLLRARGPKW